MTLRPASFTRLSVRSVSEPVQLLGEVAGQLSRIEALPFFTVTVPPLIVTGRAMGADVVPAPGFAPGPGVTVGGGVTTGGGGVTTGGGGVTTGGGGVTTDTPLTVSKPSRMSTPASDVTESLPAPPDATSPVLS